MKQMDYRKYIDGSGDFEFPNFLYKVISTLMKQTLDFGTLLSNDEAKLRAFKKQTIDMFKMRWQEIAGALEAFDIIIPCICQPNEFCKICAGSRYLMNPALSPDYISEVGFFTSGNDDAAKIKLLQGHEKALRQQAP